MIFIPNTVVNCDSLCCFVLLYAVCSITCFAVYEVLLSMGTCQCRFFSSSSSSYSFNKKLTCATKYNGT